MIKTIGKASYAHKSNVIELVTKVSEKEKDDFIQFINMINAAGLKYDVVKYNEGNITLIESPDWDTANEPTVGISKRWKKGEWFDNAGRININWVKRCGNYQVYHNKWQFVASDYKGFDIEKAKERTKQWEFIPNLDKKRIGNKKYWYALLKENGLEV